MDDMSADLGDPPPAPPAKRGGNRKARTPKATKGKAKAKEAKAPKKSKAIEEIVGEFESDQVQRAVAERPNPRGIEGMELLIRRFIIDHTVTTGEMSKLAGRMGSIAKEARKAGVPVDLVKAMLKELQKPEESVQTQNVMNQLRALVGMPHSSQIDDTSTYDGADSADERAYKAGRQAVWRGGRSQDNPYHGDVQRGQHWLRGFNDAHAEAEAASSAAQMRKLNQQAAERAKEATAA